MATVKFNKDINEILSEKRIFLEWKENSRKSMPNALTFIDSLEMEPYSGIYAGENLCTIEGYS